MQKPAFAAVVSAFGAEAKAKLSNAAAYGQPEDQLRAPLDTLIRALADIADVAGPVSLVGETRLSDLKTRPDFAVTVKHALAGFIEVKAPGKGCDPRKFSDPHDKAQWGKLKSLPNLLYTDGNGFSLWRDGERECEIVLLDGDIETSGAKLAAPETLRALIHDFLTWDPQPPKNAKGLARVAAHLCRLLREEVLEQLALGHASLTHLKHDWRKLLFPEADDAQFADGYAQAVTFGLLMARAYDIALTDIEVVAIKLKHANTLIGTALNVLTEDAASQKSLKTSLGTMLRVFNAVNWSIVSKDKPEAWLYFYEHFLEVYDNGLRKKTGSYYTPPEVVSAMTNLVDQALRGPLFERPAGLAAADVTIADPAIGTGTFLLGVLRKIAANVEVDQGAGAVSGAIAAAAKRLFGFELQFGPFAVAQLRLLAEMRALTKAKNAKKEGEEFAAPALNLFITDTLGNPFAEEEQLANVVEAIARSRREANRIKRETPIMVVIGNPPYKNQAGGMGGWIEDGSKELGRGSPMDWWTPPADWRVGAHTHHLKNLYVFFWRWAALKVFGTGWSEATKEPPFDRSGVVCFITAAGFLNGPGFVKMRDDLRRACNDIWVIDCSPEGHQPDIPTRIFQGVQQEICIVLAARKAGKDEAIPARVHFCALPLGKRAEKFAALARLSLEPDRWIQCPSDWRAPFLPDFAGKWAEFVPLPSLFHWSGAGVKPHRTWPIAPDPESLASRWERLKNAASAEEQLGLFGADRDRHINKLVSVDLGAFKVREIPIVKDKGPVVPPVRYAFRTLDRQWIIPDHRLLSMARPKLWGLLSETQIFSTALEASSPKSGPAISFTVLIPDQDHYKGSFGGRVFPLWADAQATQPNVRADLLEVLAQHYGAPVAPPDVVAYIAATLAHPAFTEKFRADLVRPGLRVPLTADANLFGEAVEIGREIVWLHCYGERFADIAAGRPKGPPRLPKGEAPVIPADGAIPGAPEALPQTMDYDPAKRRLAIGKGFVENVTPAMRAYEISGKNVLDQWFSYRRLDRTKPVIGDRRPPSPLEKIQPDHWLAEYTEDLLNLLNVLGRLVALEPQQADLLERICAGPLLAFAPAAAGGDEKPGTEGAQASR